MDDPVGIVDVVFQGQDPGEFAGLGSIGIYIILHIEYLGPAVHGPHYAITATAEQTAGSQSPGGIGYRIGNIRIQCQASISLFAIETKGSLIKISVGYDTCLIKIGSG